MDGGDDSRSVEIRRFAAVREALRRGDLGALRDAVEDPSLLPHGGLPRGFGTPLVQAIYDSPLAFIRTLLDAGANPSAPADDGFPPVIAALSCTRVVPGAMPRDDVDEILRLLLERGADPNQRGTNDYTALHMAVAERNARAVWLLLRAGADPDLRTRIDDCETPLEMARASGQHAIAGLLERRGASLERRLRAGLTLLEDIAGEGPPVARRRTYRVRLRLWLHRGEPIRWNETSAIPGGGELDDQRTTLVTDLRIDRSSLIAGLFYGLDTMRVGGWRRLEIAPHLAYGAAGVPGLVPPHAVLVAEVCVVRETLLPGYLDASDPT
ncbi:MAG TPA: ankyrin repeat domain-containing protein [Vicinamibacterales bacterium]|nr:ankyrin repeat domain-containing protein [Vicinamibacterales bacterium]